MSASPPSHQPNPTPGDDANGRTLSLLKKIDSGAVDPTCIGVPERRQLVGFLMGDGCSTAEISQILQVADRTIERDKKAIRESNALARDPRLVEQMAGRLKGEAEHCMQRIRRAVRDKKVSPSVSVDAERHCFEIFKGMIQTLQGLGHLPTAIRKVEADLTHHLGELPGFDAMRAEIRRLKGISPQANEGNSGCGQELVLLEQVVVRADLATRLDAVNRQITDGEGGSDGHD